MRRVLFEEVRKRFSRQRGAKIVANWGFWRPTADDPRWFWPINGVSFSIEGSGRRLGIIGANGSGKTTLLRLIAGVTQPTSGWVEVHGRVLPLLELFSGMQPELTGRENILMGGVLLGMRRREILGKFDSIVDFAGISGFVDMPLKHYSLGMMMRLGFSVATHVEGKIILVDEAWGIGDAEFQKKSAERLDELRQRGATLILVSHDLEVLRRLTDEILWLHGGRVEAFGPSEKVIARYLAAVQSGKIPTQPA
ncbi:MAG: teichoic acid ABC transporter ATP-binding protein [Candidatus Omnitrophica bacterium CG11_big_fil_rev_8_21_14_0_20_64_10]|nr:MAG: teichoic acid ABC transporter ATP-binding protein [Candidatus Omnitrophica bacterium CG11_big_fil_rev_8_21_14_0_20_64_10]